MFINNIMYGNNEKDHHETINGESLVQIVSMKELIITVYTILIDRDYMLNNIKTKVEEQFKPGSAEYNLGAKYYIRMKLAKTYEEAKGIYNDALVQLSSLDTIEENKKNIIKVVEILSFFFILCYYILEENRNESTY